jgi:hypothetical protein
LRSILFTGGVREGFASVSPEKNQNPSHNEPEQIVGLQGLKPASLVAAGGGAEAVPFPRPFYEIASS